MRTILLFVLTILSVSGFSQIDLKKGLIAYYPFNGNTNDYSGNGNHGIAQNGPVLTTDRLGRSDNAYYFDGVNDYIEIKDNGKLSPKNLSVVAMIYTEKASPQAIVGKIQYNNGWAATYHLGINYDVQAGYFFGVTPYSASCNEIYPYNPSNPFATTKQAFSTNEWHCLVGTFENSVLKIFIDGVLLNTQIADYNDLIQCDNTQLLIGSWWVGDNIKFKGKIDEVRIYDRALNLDEINALCDEQIPTPALCTGYLGTPVVNIDFGSGHNPGGKLESLVPGASTTLSYVSVFGNPASPIPADGQYTITNNSPYNEAWFAGFEDHTEGDVNGYMAFYNSAETPGEFYKQVVTGLQGTTTYEFSAWIANVLNPAKMNGVKPDITFSIEETNGNVLATYTTGDIPQTSSFTWKQYGFYFTTPLNAHTVVLRMINNRVGGIAQPGNDLAIDDIMFRPCISNPNAKIINDYSPVLNLDICTNTLELVDASAYNVGDTILIIQMKGAVIDTSDGPGFGMLTSYQSAGNFEFNYISEKNGNRITLQNILLRTYEIPEGLVQVVRVPSFDSYTTDTDLTALPWDGRKGGILSFLVKGTLKLGGNLDVSGKGFMGGQNNLIASGNTICEPAAYFYPADSRRAAPKGESIVNIGFDKLSGKGNLLTGGGGGSEHNSGGGGGGNHGSGGTGGYQVEQCPDLPIDNRGLGGGRLEYSYVYSKLFLGGGGGAGHGNQTNGNSVSGGNGGGLIIISAQTLISNGYSIKSEGHEPESCDKRPSILCHDGNGGGGAGGTMLLLIDNFADEHHLSVRGGKGGDLTHYNAVDKRLGPGGGGGGGAIWAKPGVNLENEDIHAEGGISGVIISDNNNPYGAEKGMNGFLTKGFIETDSFDPFIKTKIESVDFINTIPFCKSVDLIPDVKSSGPIASYNWSLGDGTNASGENMSHSYANGGTYKITLLVTDINSCTDSTSKEITLDTITAVINPDMVVCENSTADLSASGGTRYEWTPSVFLNESDISTPSATISETTRFTVTVMNDIGCMDTASTLISIYNAPVFNKPPDAEACEGVDVQLNGSNPSTFSYKWSPSVNLNNPNSSNPIARPVTDTRYSVTITEPVCGKDSTFYVNILVRQSPDLFVRKSNDIDCSHPTATLTVSGAASYNWTPAYGLNNLNVSNPVVSIDSTTTFTVTGVSTYGCVTEENITVVVSKDGKSNYPVANAFTPNGDGINDCFGLPEWGNVDLLEFSIFNRWGQKIFATKDPLQCWNGTFKGMPQETGGYIYIIKARSFCGDIVRKGNVMLVR